MDDKPLDFDFISLSWVCKMSQASVGHLIPRGIYLGERGDGKTYFRDFLCIQTHAHKYKHEYMLGLLARALLNTESNCNCKCDNLYSIITRKPLLGCFTLFTVNATYNAHNYWENTVLTVSWKQGGFWFPKQLQEDCSRYLNPRPERPDRPF